MLPAASMPVAPSQLAAGGARAGLAPAAFRRPPKHAALAAAAAILLRCAPADAGVLSGFTGIESVPAPQLPQVEFLNRWNEERQRKYAELDERFRSSQVLKQLLERSEANKEKNRRQLEDKYCLRGAEWGIGDCSMAGMTEAEKEEFIGMLRKKVEGQ